MLARLFMLRYHDPRSIRRCHEVLIVVVMVLSSPGIGLGICLLYALPSMDKLLPLECLPYTLQASLKHATAEQQVAEKEKKKLLRFP